MFQKDGKWYKLGGGTVTLHQPEHEDPAVVGAAWVAFFVRDAKLHLLQTNRVKGLVKRYVQAVPESNPDHAPIKACLKALTDNPKISRYEFCNLVRLTLSEKNCLKVRYVLSKLCLDCDNFDKSHNFPCSIPHKYFLSSREFVRI